jgi:DNA replicative helicase MCM subunit Mcm2 (Cdc46/Mcm family)
MDDIKKHIAKLKEYGLSDNKIYALIILAQEEFFDSMEDELIDADEKELSTLAETISDTEIENLDKENSSKLLESTLKKIYGISAESKIQSFIADYLADCVKEAKDVKDFLLKYQQGDPETLKKILEAKKDPNYKDMEDAFNTAQKI